MLFLFQCSDTDVGFENFRHVCHKWHFKITRTIIICLESKDYIQIRNAFVILMHIQNHFPVLAKTEQYIQKRVEKVRDEEKNKRQDLHVLASSYLGILKQKCSQLIPESEFHQVSVEQSKATNGDAAKLGEFNPSLFFNLLTGQILSADRKPPIDRERSEKKIIKVTAEREIKKETPAREASRDQGREPTPREKSVKEVKVKNEKVEDPDSARKRDKDKDRRRVKRPSSPPADHFEGDLSSVSNSSSGSSQPNADLVIVEDIRGELPERF